MAEKPIPLDREIPIKCPVCPSPETVKNPCPQCGTDLEPLRRLKRLPRLLEEKAFSPSSSDAALGALAYLAAAAALDPASVDTRLALARNLMAAGHLEEARTTVQQILDQQPDHPEAQSLAELIAEAASRHAQEAKAHQKARRSLNRWRLFSLGAAAGLLVILLVKVGRQPLEGISSSPPKKPPGLSQAEIISPKPESAAVIVDPRFPAVSFIRDQEGVKVQGEVKTLPELLVMLKQTTPVHHLNLEELKVQYSHSFPYRVRRRDTLKSLARRFYGQEAKWHVIQEANAEVLRNPDLLRPGEELLIPGLTRTSDGNAPDPDNR